MSSNPTSTLIEALSQKALALRFVLPASIVLLVSMQQQLMLPIAFACIVAASMHGALDMAILLRRFAPAQSVLLTLGYAVLALCCYFFYQAQPQFAAPIFLLISAWHFAPLLDNSLFRALSGTCIIAAPLLFSNDAARWLQMQMPSASSAAVLWIWLVLCIGAVLLSRSSLRERAVFAIYCALAALLHPLLWFAMFFAFEHSFRHFRVLQQQKLMDAIALALGFAALLLVLLFTAAVSQKWELQSLLQQHLAALLFAISLPHILLIDSASRYWLRPSE
jgi:beta-carotene 15,15'-dioxygenase